MKTSGANSEHKHSEIKRFWTLTVRLCMGIFFVQVAANWPFVAKR